ncbi:hypothetical protein GCK72_007442 [Caenorhabditis remanei]|uniref:BTB domain-containing protein n=1 Tax=Caenorhabditis remanei TaxID=31234 RepID=A0A6A5HM86_CAERE|nr:hypothetical protein GCK72_007442 [Caenorhabditis remanei]KAF1767483.1 hypothetical protein GCK72_007442 [Caenorhabditis remanei]
MSDTADDANNNLMLKFQKLQSETNEIQSIFSKQSSFDATSLSGNKMLKDICESMRNQQKEQNKFNEELLKTNKDLKDQNTELKNQSEQVLKEIRSIKSDLEESKKQHSLEMQSMKKLMSVPDSVDSSLFPDTSVKNNTSASVTGKEFVFKHVFENAPENGSNQIHSEKEEHFNIPWYDSGKVRKPMLISGEYDFNDTEFDWKIMEDEYGKGGKLQVELRVKITKTTGLYGKPLRNFDERNKSFSDVVILLIAQSAYFKSLLSEISPNAEVELSDIDPEDFQVYLEALYGEPAINEKTVEVVLYMPEKYDTHAVTKKCEEFLIDESRKKKKKKLQLAIKYKLEKLKKHCFDNINTAAL